MARRGSSGRALWFEAFRAAAAHMKFTALGVRSLRCTGNEGNGGAWSSMAANSIPRRTPSTESRRLPVTRWLGRSMRPSFFDVDAQHLCLSSD